LFENLLNYTIFVQLVLQDSGVFEMMGLAHEMGLEELRVSCEDHVTSTLAVANACTFLAAALDMHERSAPHGPFYFAIISIQNFNVKNIPTQEGEERRISWTPASRL
jgi:hypothetical protein